MARPSTNVAYKSQFEQKLAAQLRKAKVKFEYESTKLPYILERNYIPDFILPNGVIIEAKGKFDAQSRSKMAAVKKAHPELDIRFVFMRASNKLSKRSKMTYGEWADKYGFPWADSSIPKEWYKS